MRKYRIKGMLAGDKIDIRCTKNQAVVIRNRLADLLDESTKVEDNRYMIPKPRDIDSKDRFLTGIDRHRGMCKEPGDMIRGGG